MKAVSEFPAHILTKGIAAKAALLAEGKSEEEISTSLGETFKFKDNRLKYFIAALGVAEANTEKLYRVRLFTFNEGENIPEKATLIEEVYYIPEFFQGLQPAKPIVTRADARAGGKKDKPRGPKSSPWGMSPEEIEEKKAASARAAAAKAPKA